jgi:hypothetical protein
VYFGVLIYRQWMKTKREDKEQRDKVIAAIRASTDHPIMNV